MNSEHRLQSTSLPFGNIPYSEVRSAFEGFIPPGELDRGRYRRRVSPFRKSSGLDDKSYTPDYHVRSTFSPQQRPYIATVTTHIDALAQGKTFSDKDTILPFRLLVDGMFLRQEGDYSFNKAFLEANMEMLAEFSRLYSSLVPALRAYYQTGGTTGTGAVMEIARVHLKNAICAHNTDSEMFFMGLEKWGFVSRHPVILGKQGVVIHPEVSEYEVWCAGITIAKTLYRESALAAMDLAQIDQIRSNYDPKMDDDIHRADLENRLNSHVEQLYLEVEEKYRQGIL